MKGEGNPPDLYLVLFLKPFNTPGDEVAPGSDVIGENLQDESIVLVHGMISSIVISEIMRQFLPPLSMPHYWLVLLRFLAIVTE